MLLLLSVHYLAVTKGEHVTDSSPEGFSDRAGTEITS